MQIGSDYTRFSWRGLIDWPSPEIMTENTAYKVGNTVWLKVLQNRNKTVWDGMIDRLSVLVKSNTTAGDVWEQVEVNSSEIDNPLEADCIYYDQKSKGVCKELNSKSLCHQKRNLPHVTCIFLLSTILAKVRIQTPVVWLICIY